MREDGRGYEGWNIGAVSVKRVRLHDSDIVQADILRHGGFFPAYPPTS